MNLWTLRAHEKASIDQIDAAIPNQYIMRLAELGMRRGSEVECLRESPFAGPKSFHVGDGIFSLDRQIAQYIHVSRIQK